MSPPVSIQTPWPAVLVAAIPLLYWFALRGRRWLGRMHMLAVTTLRALAILCVAAALMRPQWHGGTADVSVVYAIDVSRSVPSSSIESALEWIARADREGRPAQARYLAFADHPALLSRLEDVRSLAVTDGGRAPRGADPAVVDQSATNLERALTDALTGLDADLAKRIVLMTDANQTAGDVWRSLPALQRAKARVFAIPARERADSDAWVAGIDVPAGVSADEPVSIVVRVVCATQAVARVSLRGPRAVIGAREVRLQPGVTRVAFAARLPRAGAQTLGAEVAVAGDPVPQNDRLHRTVWVQERPRVLQVEGGGDGTARYLADALRGQGMVVQVVAPDGLPTSAQALAGYDALVLSDVPAKSIPPEAMQTIESYVRDAGGGLLFAGGENVHGELGYAGTPVEKVLPVEFRAREKRKDLAMVIALDRSYSMKGRKMEMAKEATRAALDLLEEQHRFALVAFDSQTYIAVPMQYVRSRRKAEDQISRIQASGQTNIYPALGIVYRMLQKVDSKAKHVILLSDGDTHPADFETLVKRMAAEKIVVSTVAVGADADRGLMGDIARWGHGRAYVAENADAIPQIFIDEASRAVNSSLLEESFRPVARHRAAALEGMDASRLPELKGLVSSKARDHAEVVLAAPSGAPLLARWQYGLGTAVAFTSDVKNRWAAGWIGWPGYGRFWAQQVRDLMRRDTGEALDFRVMPESTGTLVRLSVLASDGSFRNHLQPKVRVTRADGAAASITLEQTGLGRYEAHLPARAPVGSERYELVEVAGASSRLLRRAGVRVLHQDFKDEYRSLPADTALLEALTGATGGKVNPSIAEVFDRGGAEGRARLPLWPWLAGLALLAYLLDIAVRRSPLAWRWLEPRRSA
ncbi:MAG TPA: VWA domain-containing protein [Burkholderiales bacterium]|nr:VWA domain-containing protein [Burkholderiales bacterium]